MTLLIWLIMLAPLGAVLFLSFRIEQMSALAAQTTFWTYAALMGLVKRTLSPLTPAGLGRLNALLGSRVDLYQLAMGPFNCIRRRHALDRFGVHVHENVFGNRFRRRSARWAGIAERSLSGLSAGGRWIRTCSTALRGRW